MPVGLHDFGLSKGSRGALFNLLLSSRVEDWANIPFYAGPLD
jgi:hypothetical protein